MAGKRVPRAVLCGSTNFTENGVYRQANVVHVLRREDVAECYLDLFEVLEGADVPATRHITEHNPDTSAGLFAGFSPRSAARIYRPLSKRSPRPSATYSSARPSTLTTT